MTSCPSEVNRMAVFRGGALDGFSTEAKTEAVVFRLVSSLGETWLLYDRCEKTGDYFHDPKEGTHDPEKLTAADRKYLLDLPHVECEQRKVSVDGNTFLVWVPARQVRGGAKG